MWTAAEGGAVRRARPLKIMRRERGGWNVSSHYFLAWLSECDVITALLNYSSTLRTEGRDVIEHTKRTTSLAQSFLLLELRLTLLYVLSSLIWLCGAFPSHFVVSNPANLTSLGGFALAVCCVAPFPLRTLDLRSGTKSGDQVT